MAAAKIAPSMLSSDFANLASEAERMVRLGADWLHMDIMVRSPSPFRPIPSHLLRAQAQHGSTANTNKQRPLIRDPSDSISGQPAGLSTLPVTVSYGVHRIELPLTNLLLDPFFTNLELAHHFEREVAVASITMKIRFYAILWHLE